MRPGRAVKRSLLSLIGLSILDFSPDRLRLLANKGWIDVDATTAEVEDLLNAEYHVYAHPSTASEQMDGSSFRTAVKKLF